MYAHLVLYGLLYNSFLFGGFQPPGFSTLLFPVEMIMRTKLRMKHENERYK